MPNRPLYRGLMGANTGQPTDPSGRLRAMQERVANRPGMPGMPPRPNSGQNTGIIPPHMQQRQPAAQLDLPARVPRGQPAPSGALTAQPGGVTIPDAARAPRLRR